MDKEKKIHYVIKYIFIFLCMNIVYVFTDFAIAISYRVFYTPKTLFFFPIIYVFIITPAMFLYLLCNNLLKILLFICILCYAIFDGYDTNPLRTLAILISFSAAIFSCHVLLYLFAIREDNTKSSEKNGQVI